MVTEIGKNEPKDIKNGGVALSQVSPNWGAPCLLNFFHRTSLKTRKVYHPFRQQAARKSLTSSTGRITNEQPGTDAAYSCARVGSLPSPRPLFKTAISAGTNALISANQHGRSLLSLNSALPGTMEDSGGRTFIILPIKAIFHITAEIVWRRVLQIFSNFIQVFGNEQSF